jgi:hypothetical protein
MTATKQGRPRIIQRSRPEKTRHYKNNDALYNIDSQRRKFLADIRTYGKHDVIDVRGQRERCGMFPACKKSAVELWKWHTHMEFLCETELAELQKWSEK